MNRTLTPCRRQFKVFGGKKDDFQNYYDACAWLKKNGYSYGSMQREAPIGVMKGEFSISKWRGMSEYEKNRLDGTIEFLDGDPRFGRVVVKVKS